MIQSSRKTRVIGLTGGIGTGKSTVSKILMSKGFPIIDADIIARQVVEVGKPAYNDVVCYFGKEILNDDLTINRGKLGDIIFNNIESRRKLNSIVHPRVTGEMIRQIEKYSENNKVIFLDIPLLIEVKEKLKELPIDEIWLVYVSEEIQIKRLMKRDSIDFNKASARIKAQMPIDKKKKFADVIIDNTKDITTLEKELDRIIAKLT